MNDLQAYRIEQASDTDIEEILALYRSMIGGKADWTEDYPCMDTITFDLSRDALFVMKNERNEIIAAISIDEDADVAALPCWSPDLQPSGELARVCVRADMQNRGIARKMMQYTFAVLRRQGCKSVHILVRPANEAALRSYLPLGYVQVGTCELFGKDFLCFEKRLL